MEFTYDYPKYTSRIAQANCVDPDVNDPGYTLGILTIPNS